MPENVRDRGSELILQKCLVTMRPLAPLLGALIFHDGSRGFADSTPGYFL